MVKILNTFRQVEGEFECSFCGKPIQSGNDHCPLCGGVFTKEDVQKSKITAIESNKRRIEEAHSRQIYCQSCGTSQSQIEATERSWKCPQCGSMLEPGHEQVNNPDAEPAQIPVKPVQEPEPVQIAAKTIDVKIFLYIALAIIGLALAVWGVIALVKHSQKLSERHPSIGFVTEHQWSTYYETVKPFAVRKNSDSPVTGDLITPLPKATEFVEMKPNPLPTYELTKIVPGPTEVTYGKSYDCPLSKATPSMNEDGSFNIPLCADETFTPGEAEVRKWFVEPMGTPTPIFKDVYPYVLTGFEPATPLLQSGDGLNVSCPDKSALTLGWKISSDCVKQFFVVVTLSDSDKSTTKQVDETRFNNLKDGDSVKIMLDGYGDIAEVILP